MRLARKATSAESLLLDHELGDILDNIDNPSAPYPELVTLMRAAGPVNSVDPGDPPTFLAHGEDDGTVPVTQSIELHAALQSAGVQTQYIQVPGAGHSLQQMPIDVAIDYVRAALLSVSACLAYLDASGDVDASDLAALLASWGGATNDLTGDGVVDAADLATLLSAWGAGCAG